MSTAQLEIQLVAAVVAVACSLPGVFLILRRMAMMSDAISHAILFGIVLAFFVVEDITSPFLVVGAALTGVLTVSLVEALHRTRLVKADAAIGLVFPVLFSIGVILIARYAGNVHLDIDAVLLGELAFAPFNRFVVAGYDLGPISFYVMGGILLLNILFIALFYKELKLASFDAGLAAAIGFSPTLIHYALMTQVSLTAVGAFDAVGSILVVALMVAPPAAAYLLTDRLSRMLLISAGVGIASAIGGYWTANLFDVNIAGSMASMAGLIFLLVYLTAPGRGLIAVARRNLHQRWEFAQRMLAVHLLHHQGLPEAQQECHVHSVHEHLNWEQEFARRVARLAEKEGLIYQERGLLLLTGKGRDLAEEAMLY
ncbi:MAG: metal ABC transporter permease [Calditrichaeota bacterium]|nr:metal ABC transporter permease [Calditrichota bacterium]MCB0304920.1 metal ABC transporter permease [Calditrichota bacterium]MCB0312325.1 metal ABC transporter permease [Calditrichota bacterium]MCB9090877.1 metal ABC transporter permease [Calditrichia bacterium]